MNTFRVVCPCCDEQLLVHVRPGEIAVESVDDWENEDAATEIFDRDDGESTGAESP